MNIGWLKLLIVFTRKNFEYVYAVSFNDFLTIFLENCLIYKERENL